MDKIDTHWFFKNNYSITNHIFLFNYLKYEINIIESWNEITKKNCSTCSFLSVVE